MARQIEMGARGGGGGTGDARDGEARRARVRLDELQLHGLLALRRRLELLLHRRHVHLHRRTAVAIRGRTRCESNLRMSVSAFPAHPPSLAGRVIRFEGSRSFRNGVRAVQHCMLAVAPWAEKLLWRPRRNGMEWNGR